MRRLPRQSVVNFAVLGAVFVVCMVAYISSFHATPDDFALAAAGHQEENGQSPSVRISAPGMDSNRLLAGTQRQVPLNLSFDVQQAIDQSDGDRRGYQASFLAWLHEECGSYVAAAMYDPKLFAVLASRAARNESLLEHEGWSWDLGMRFARPTPPAAFATIDHQLLLTKRLISIAVGRLHRDASVQRHHDDLVSTINNAAASATDRAAALVALRAMRSSVRRALQGVKHYFFTVLQLIVDALDDGKSERLTLQRAAKALRRSGRDPLLESLQHITGSTTSAADVAAIRDLVIRSLETLQQDAVSSTSRGLGALHSIDYHQPPYEQQGPLTGKFWNMIRPVTSCASMMRMCEAPDGCRTICNAEYLLYSDSNRSHRFVGFGSNNEYEWEVSLLRLFSRNRVPELSHAIVGSITTFDCTLKGGKWSPPLELRAEPVGFGFASKCIDQRSSSMSLTMSEVKNFILDSESAFGRVVKQTSPSSHALQSGISVNVNDGKDSVTRFTANEMSHLTHRRADDDGAADGDDLTILKLDIEGFEFVVVPQWARGELHDVGTRHLAQLERETSHSSVSVTPIQFRSPESAYFTVSLLQMEFHRMGHKRMFGSSLAGALRSHYLLLHLYSLGFVMISHEKNHADNCCYEVGWAHQRHFVLSEVWMSQRP